MVIIIDNYLPLFPLSGPYIFLCSIHVSVFCLTTVWANNLDSEFRTIIKWALKWEWWIIIVAERSYGQQVYRSGSLLLLELTVQSRTDQESAKPDGNICAKKNLSIWKSSHFLWKSGQSCARVHLQSCFCFGCWVPRVLCGALTVLPLPVECWDQRCSSTCPACSLVL